jgi:hypothetical protein
MIAIGKSQGDYQQTVHSRLMVYREYIQEGVLHAMVFTVHFAIAINLSAALTQDVAIENNSRPCSVLGSMFFDCIKQWIVTDKWPSGARAHRPWHACMTRSGAAVAVSFFSVL